MLLPLLQNNLLETAGATAEVAATLTESGIVAGGGEITLTLTNDTWVTAGATFDAQRQAILDGFTATTLDLSTQSVTTVVRTSDTLVTITLEAVSGYSIGADETVSVTVPGAALTGGSDLDAGSFVVADDVADEEEIRSGGWGALNQYDAYKQRQKRREKERERLLEAVSQIEDDVDREIAELLQKSEIERDEERALTELEELVRNSFSKESAEQAKAFSERVGKAYLRAFEQGNYSALRALEREIERAREEEDFLFMAIAVL